MSFCPKSFIHICLKVLKIPKTGANWWPLFWILKLHGTYAATSRLYLQKWPGEHLAGLSLLPHILVWFSALNCQAQCCWFDVECGVKTVTHHHTAE